MATSKVLKTKVQVRPYNSRSDGGDEFEGILYHAHLQLCLKFKQLSLWRGQHAHSMAGFCP